MCSTPDSLRRFLHAGAAVVASATPFLLISGCQRVQAPRPDRLTAIYANGGTVAGSARLTFEPKDDSRLNYAADPAIGLANFVLIPFTYFDTPPFKKIEHHGAIVPPTYTAEPQPQVIR